MGEPMLIIAIFVSLSMLLPLAFPCTPTNCYIKQGDSKPYCPEGTSSNIRSTCPFAVVLRPQTKVSTAFTGHTNHHVFLQTETHLPLQELFSNLTPTLLRGHLHARSVF